MKEQLAIWYMITVFIASTSIISMTMMDQLSLVPQMSNHHVAYILGALGYVVFFINVKLYADVVEHG